MKGTKFFGIGAVSVVCVLTMLLTGEAGSVSADWPPPGGTVYPGYAKLNDLAPYIIRSDNGSQYVDVHISNPSSGPGDKVELAINDSTLIGALLYLGKPEPRSTPPSPLGENPPTYCSTRKANLYFDLLNDGKILQPQYKKHKAVFDILVWKKGKVGKERRGVPISGKYYLSDNSVHVGVRRWTDVSGAKVHDIIFTVEPAPDPCNGGCGVNAVTQTTVNDFYPKDTNWDYTDAVDAGTGSCALIIYFLSYDNDFTVVPVGDSTWTITGGGKAHLGVQLNGDGMVYLADYTDLPFQVTVSRTELPAAPRRPMLSPASKLSVIWGELKGK
ncbi:hypothetical protein FJZ31_16375 [Candidatus Poribacteria bacterium]|nr:hypothetical protein [Candidatus Poribacteria bacterium]